MFDEESVLLLKGFGFSFCWLLVLLPLTGFVASYSVCLVMLKVFGSRVALC